MSTQDVLRTLRGLQELDRDLFRVRSELRRLPEERARRRAAIDGKVSRREEIERERTLLRAKIKEIEDLTTKHRQRIRKLDGQAAEARGDVALQAAFQHEIRSLKREISEAEEEGLALVEQADERERAASELQAEIDADEAVFAEYAGNVETEIADADRRREALEARRSERMASELDPTVLAQYERLLEAREGIALAELEGRTCQGCYMEVPNNIYVRLARGTEIVRCPNCDRMLYLPEGE